MVKQKSNFIGYFFNILSLIGMVLAVVATGLIIVFLAYESITGIEKPYLGLMTYFLFPGMLIAGLVMIPVGALRVRKERRLKGVAGILPFPASTSMTHINGMSSSFSSSPLSSLCLSSP